MVSFRDYGHGGIGGEVNGEPILLGSLEFLQDMGVEIPQGTMVNQAVYVSIDGQLAAVIAISYAKMRSASAGLVSLCGCRKLKTLLLAGDFMLTDGFIREKFNIRTRRLILPPQEERADLAARKADPEADVLALLTRDDLISSAYAITGSMSLRTACRVGSAYSSTLCWPLSSVSSSPQLCWALSLKFPRSFGLRQSHSTSRVFLPSSAMEMPR